MAFQYTCYTCHVAFRDPDIQREHYKTDWHKYNLKRKVAELPPVTAENFQEKVIAQKAQVTEESEKFSTYCETCKKSFCNQKAYENHLQSKRHKENLLKAPRKAKSEEVVRAKKHSESSEEMEVEEVDSDEWEEFEGDAIPTSSCLFCPHESDNMEHNLAHMSLQHSFFVPDVEYLTDSEGLLEYLGAKVGQGTMCLWCNERGRHFGSVQAVQQHMVDKGHCKMLHEGEALLEYSDFYDYSSSYPDESQDKDEEVDVPVLTPEEDCQLVLPSGRSVGHRALVRYYKQRLQPVSVQTLQRNKQRVANVMSQYKALGWKETSREAVKRKAKDLHFMRWVHAKQELKLRVKANKLQNYRPQIRF